MENDKIIILEQQMKEVVEKIDKLDKKIDSGLAEIKKEMFQYVRKDTYELDMKAVRKQDRQRGKEIKAVNDAVKATNSLVNKLIWLLASTILGFIAIQVLERII